MSSFVLFIDLNKKYKFVFMLSIIIISSLVLLINKVINNCYEIVVASNCCRSRKMRVKYASLMIYILKYFKVHTTIYVAMYE